MSSSAQLMMLLAFAFAVSIFVVLVISQGKWLSKKIKYKRLSTNFQANNIK